MKTVQRFSFAIALAIVVSSGALAASTSASTPDTGSDEVSPVAQSETPVVQSKAFSQRGLASTLAATSKIEKVSESTMSKRTVTESTVTENSVPAKATASARSATPLASALNRKTAAARNPYGDIHEKKGLWPYKPGQKYDRKNERGGSGLFGGLFGG